MRLAKKVGFSAVSGLGSPSMRYLELHYFVREAAAVVKENWTETYKNSSL